MPSLQARIARAGVRFSGMLVSAYLPVKYQRFMLDNAAPTFFLGARSCGLEREERCCVPAVWLDPKGADRNRVMLFLHGGGFVLGNINSHRKMVSRLAEAAGCRALMIEYGLAPENLFPTAVEDSVGAYRWLLSEGYEPANIALAGDSAGGSITVAVLVSLRDAGDPLPAAAVLISPWLDLEVSGESARSNAWKDPLLRAFDLKRWGRMYLGGADPRTPLASPIYADLRDLPPMLIQVGTREVLLDDARRLAEKAKRDGCSVELEVWEDMWHDWHTFAPMVPESREAVRKTGEFLRDKLG
jgi:epsilon-lactone hydrolase